MKKKRVNEYSELRLSNKNSDKILCDPQGSAACEQHLGYRKCVCNSFIYTDLETGIEEALPAFTKGTSWGKSLPLGISEQPNIGVHSVNSFNVICGLLDE